MEHKKDKKTMPISIHAHHALLDGYHLALFIEHFQNLMDCTSTNGNHT
ncbi:chloramphenicol O-acetyltransferase [Zunongwangia atlantica 22II14-10F7]|uniref:Chloramphenicol O-acetyltransferase n=1 Tax=Zunongwangia atlantica 22II14-10F7 TaxID=1185767 RepID=A0A1Y1T865_9FLAO|nr:chloramphenicol O-acetyltransferase [Zunongwangia atlantica 22II14-10F7]